MTHNPERVPKLAIFDPQYQNPSMPPVLDSVTRELRHVPHEITVHARTLGGAVNALLATKNEELPRPDAFVIAGMLHETHTYLDRPASITLPVERRRWPFREKRIGKAHFLLVPNVDRDNGITLPKSELGGLLSSTDQHRLERSAAKQNVKPGPYIIAHLARYLFGEDAPKLIGHGDLGTLPLDEVTPRVANPTRPGRSLAQAVSMLVDDRFAKSSPLQHAQPHSS